MHLNTNPPTEDTLKPMIRGRAVESRQVLCLTVLWHRDVSRVGERVWLHDLSVGGSVEVSRLTPDFSAPHAGRAEPLACRCLSRKPVWLEGLGEDLVEIVIEEGVHDVVVDGERVVEARALRKRELERGVVIEMSGEVALLLQKADPLLHRKAPDAGLVGESDAIAAIRNSIQQVADLDTPVILLGETGAGKDLVARAIHEAGPRSAHPFVSRNMAAIPPTTAAAELFGHEKGAFTDAVTSRDGCFQRAHQGTLFLDEIADTPHDVQAMLLRVLESGEAQRVGGREPDPVDVRVIAATDQNLAPVDGEEPLRSALRFRLSGFNLPVPPLRERRDDIGRLLLHFLRMELKQTGELHRLEHPGSTEPCLISSEQIRKLVSYDWPGNVRQLHNFVRHLVISSRGAPELHLHLVEELLERTVAATTTEPGPAAGRPQPDPQPAAGQRRSRAERAQLDAARLQAALMANQGSVAGAARDLGVSRTTIYAMMKRHEGLRTPRDIPREEIAERWEATGGSVPETAAGLHVSERALKLRLRDLGFL